MQGRSITSKPSVSKSRFVGFALTAAFFLGSLLTSGCVHNNRYYDPSHNDYHTWNSGEVVYYQQWAVETHHDPHRNFNKMNKDEQNDYWNWRHNHPDK